LNIEDTLPLINTLVTRDFNKFGGNEHGFGKCIMYLEGDKLVRLVSMDTRNGVLVEKTGSAFGFIVKEDNTVKSDKGVYFKRGDILKASSWSAPAKNFARGNVFNLTDASVIPWTGVSNLKE